MSLGSQLVPGAHSDWKGWVEAPCAKGAQRATAMRAAKIVATSAPERRARRGRLDSLINSPISCALVTLISSAISAARIAIGLALPDAFTVPFDGVLRALLPHAPAIPFDEPLAAIFGLGSRIRADDIGGGGGEGLVRAQRDAMLVLNDGPEVVGRPRRAPGEVSTDGLGRRVRADGDGRRRGSVCAVGAVLEVDGRRRRLGIDARREM